mgnify:CR=1 FL=1
MLGFSSPHKVFDKNTLQYDSVNITVYNDTKNIENFLDKVERGIL